MSTFPIFSHNGWFHWVYQTEPSDHGTHSFTVEFLALKQLVTADLPWPSMTYQRISLKTRGNLQLFISLISWVLIYCRWILQHVPSRKVIIIIVYNRCKCFSSIFYIQLFTLSRLQLQVWPRMRMQRMRMMSSDLEVTAAWTAGKARTSVPYSTGIHAPSFLAKDLKAMKLSIPEIADLYATAPCWKLSPARHLYRWVSPLMLRMVFAKGKRSAVGPTAVSRRTCWILADSQGFSHIFPIQGHQAMRQFLQNSRPWPVLCGMLPYDTQAPLSGWIFDTSCAGGFSRTLNWVTA